ncbi:MAG: mycothione reductase [Pseudonocardiales bacterium]|nr:mycothione reductase [Pseudonocardiales bacterium]MBV9029174.1 mycothione reductase [Pseudonocardiales bacterium]
MKSYDLVVVGAGSGNMLLGPEPGPLRAAIIEPDRFGGTCLNRGCIPSKMLVVAADAARAVVEARRLGVYATLDRVDWPAIRARVFGRLDPLHDGAVAYRRRNGVDVYPSAARFTAPRMLDVGGEQLTARQIVVAVGARPVVPPIPGLDTVAFHTSDTIMRVDEVPASLVVIGGGVIAAELGHVFDAFGATVSIVQRGPRLLMAEDEQVSARFTELAQRRFRVLLNTTVTAVAPRSGGVSVTVERDGRTEVLTAAMLLVATGRRPNTDLLDAAAGGLEVDGHGHLVTDDTYQTSVPGVWAFGDATNHFQLKHMANAEARIVRHNLTHPDAPRRLPHTLVPHAVFSDPQIAGVGLTEAQARRRGTDHVIAVRRYADTAYGWALEDTNSFVKLVADPHTRTLLGAHIIGPQAATLLQPLLQAMMLGQSVDQLAHDVLYIHPALTEVLEQALLEL